MMYMNSDGIVSLNPRKFFSRKLNVRTKRTSSFFLLKSNDKTAKSETCPGEKYQGKLEVFEHDFPNDYIGKWSLIGTS